MKNIILFLILFLTTQVSAQRYFYSGIYLSTKEGNLGFVQVEEDIDIAILRCEYLTNFNGDNRLYLKIQFQVFKARDFRFFIAMPPLHNSFKEGGYNTPFNFEVMWKKKLLLNTDIYTNGVNFSVQFRHKF